MSTSVSLTFYTEATTADQTVTETALHTAVPGQLDLDDGRTRPTDAGLGSTPVRRYLFYPANILTGIVYGVKATDGTINYAVEEEETFDDHQEIYLRRIS